MLGSVLVSCGRLTLLGTNHFWNGSTFFLTASRVAPLGIVKSIVLDHAVQLKPEDSRAAEQAAERSHSSGSSPQQGRKQTIGLLWYQYDLQEHPPYLNDNYRKLGASSFKASTEAIARTVAAKDAKPSDSPHPQFEYVTVKI